MYSGHVYRSPGKMIAMVMGLANYYKPYLFTYKHHDIIIMIESQKGQRHAIQMELQKWALN